METPETFRVDCQTPTHHHYVTGLTLWQAQKLSAHLKQWHKDAQIRVTVEAKG